MSGGTPRSWCRTYRRFFTEFLVEAQSLQGIDNSMLFRGAVRAEGIVDTNPAFEQVKLIKVDLTDGFYRVWVGLCNVLEQRQRAGVGDRLGYFPVIS